MVKLMKLLIIGFLLISIVGCNRNEANPEYPKCDLNGKSNETIDRMVIECRGIDLEPFLLLIENNASFELRTIDIDILFQLIVDEKSFVLILFHTGNDQVRMVWERYYYFLTNNPDLIIRENVLFMHWSEIHNNNIPRYFVGGPFVWFDGDIGAIANISYIEGVFTNILFFELNERDFERLRDPSLPVFVGNDKIFISAPEKLTFSIEELLAIYHLTLDEAFGVTYGGGVLAFHSYVEHIFYVWVGSADKTTIEMTFPLEYLEWLRESLPRVYIFEFAVVNHSMEDFETYIWFSHFNKESLDDIVGDIVVHTIKITITE